MTDQITINDLIDNVGAIRDFTSQKPVLRLPESNYFQIRNQRFELRMFTFYTATPNLTFQEFIKSQDLCQVELKPSMAQKRLQVLSFSINTDDVYLIISIIPA